MGIVKKKPRQTRKQANKKTEMRWLPCPLYFFWCSQDETVMHCKDLLIPSIVLILKRFKLHRITVNVTLYCTSSKIPMNSLPHFKDFLEIPTEKKRWKTWIYSCSSLCFQIWLRLRTLTIWFTSVSLVLWSWFIIDRDSHDISHYQDCHIHWHSQKTQCLRSI